MSSSSHKDDLDSQTEFLKTFANARGMIIDEVITDIGSGLNDSQKKWNGLPDECQEGKIGTVLIAHKDRFIRFGYDWFERFLQKCGTEIVVIHNEKFSLEQEMVSDFISIIYVFSCRIDGLRTYKKIIREDRELE